MFLWWELIHALKWGVESNIMVVILHKGNEENAFVHTNVFSGTTRFKNRIRVWAYLCDSKISKSLGHRLKQ